MRRLLQDGDPRISYPCSIFVFRYSSTIVLQTVVAATTMTVGLKKPVLKRVSLPEALDAQVKNFVNTV